ncbi:MAG: hypothetical protein HKN44_04300 [Ilumatobacter sp.]|nr:hypothetical protein [Ilumatobacter sp.]
MTDAAETSGPSDTPTGTAPPSPASRLLDLQRIDTEADQLRVRRERLAERDELAARTEQLATWEQRRTELTTRIAELGAEIESAEETGAALTADRTRFEAQMKTVIAPREAEALMHEIETVDAKRDEVDDRELAALEQQAELDDALVAHLEEEAALRAALVQADEALAAVAADIDAQLRELDARRAAAIGELDDPTATRYESVRGNLGVAVAELNGHRCEGCHLDLSAAEVDTAKDEAATSGYTDCPQCGRLLIV